MTKNTPRAMRTRTVSQTTDDLAALPYPPRDLERDDVGHDERDTEPDERPAVRDARGGDAEDGEDRRGQPDHETGDLLAGARGADDRGDDEHPAARGDQIEERDDEQREEDLRWECLAHARRAEERRAQHVIDREAAGADDHDRPDHAEQLADDDVQVADRRREQRYERAVLLLLRERRGDERDPGEGRDERALQREDEDRDVVRPARARSASADHEQDRQQREEAGADDRAAVAEDLPADLTPGDERGLTHFVPQDCALRRRSRSTRPRASALHAPA